MSEEERVLFNRTYSDATYTYNQFKQDVVQTLSGYFGQQNISIGNKCIKLAKNHNRVDADVLACLEYRKYKRFRSLSDQEYIPGVKFYTVRENQRIVNYPKVHFENGANKNSQYRTDGKYKHTVRIFKNFNKKLVEDGRLNNGTAPSYFIECLLYNTPDGLFRDNYQDTVVLLFDFLINKCDTSRFLTVNEQHNLFEDGQWNVQDAYSFLREALNLYDGN